MRRVLRGTEIKPSQHALASELCAHIYNGEIPSWHTSQRMSKGNRFNVVFFRTQAADA